MLDGLKGLDTSLFLLINGAHHPVLDFIMYWASDRFIWIPFYLYLLWLISRSINDKSKLVPLLLTIGLLIVTSDQLTVVLFKNTVHRLRPCHRVDLRALIHLVGGCGGEYGFLSSHAANCFAIASMLVVSFNNALPRLKYILFPWALFVGYSRIYNGVHFPTDVLAGALFGALLGYVFSILYKRVESRKSKV